MKSSSPTLSLFLIAEKASTLAISAASSRLLCAPEPKSPDALTSTMSRSVSSRSSTNFFTNGRPARAVTFQSMVRTSSPGTYSRTASKFMPRPLKTLWYWPASESVTSRLVRISICRTFFRISRVCSEFISRVALACVETAHQGTGRPSRMPAMMFSEAMFSASAS